MDALIAAFARDAMGICNRKGYSNVDRKSQASTMWRFFQSHIRHTPLMHVVKLVLKMIGQVEAAARVILKVPTANRGSF